MAVDSMGRSLFVLSTRKIHIDPRIQMGLGVLCPHEYILLRSRMPPILEQSIPTSFCDWLFSPLWPFSVGESHLGLTHHHHSDYLQLYSEKTCSIYWSWEKVLGVATEVFHIMFLAIHWSLFILKQMVGSIENFVPYNHDFTPHSSLLRCVDQLRDTWTVPWYPPTHPISSINLDGLCCSWL